MWKKRIHLIARRILLFFFNLKKISLTLTLLTHFNRLWKSRVLSIRGNVFFFFFLTFWFRFRLKTHLLNPNAVKKKENCNKHELNKPAFFNIFLVRGPIKLFKKFRGPRFFFNKKITKSLHIGTQQKISLMITKLIILILSLGYPILWYFSIILDKEGIDLISSAAEDSYISKQKSIKTGFIKFHQW